MFYDTVSDKLLDLQYFNYTEKAQKCSLIKYYIYLLQNGTLIFERDIIISNLKLMLDHESPEILRFAAKVIVQSQSSKTLEIAYAYKNTECAKIILSQTKILSEQELMNILGNSIDREHLLSYIATKKNITNILSDYVVSRKDRHSLIKLLHNKNAAIPAELLSDLWIEYFEEKELRHLILERIIKVRTSFPSLIKKASPEQLEVIKEFFTKHLPNTAIYFANHKHLESINYFLDEQSIMLKQSRVNELITDNALTNFTLCKMLAHGDIPSFTYGVAQLTHSNFQATEHIFKTDINSDTIPKLLSECGFEVTLIKEVIYIFKLIYATCLEEYLDSKNFRNVMANKISLDHRLNRTHYIGAIITDGIK